MMLSGQCTVSPVSCESGSACTKTAPRTHTWNVDPPFCKDGANPGKSGPLRTPPQCAAQLNDGEGWHQTLSALSVPGVKANLSMIGALAHASGKWWAPA